MSSSELIALRDAETYEHAGEHARHPRRHDVPDGKILDRHPRNAWPSQASNQQDSRVTSTTTVDLI